MKRRATALGLAAGAVALAVPVIWAAAVEPYRLDCRDEVAHLPGLPLAWEGQRLALLGDLQVGIRFANLATARRAVREALAARPAVALLTGDFLYHATRGLAAQLRTLADLLQPLPAAGIPTYAVLGNHDYPFSHPVPSPNAAPSVRALRAALGALGVRVLDNEAVPLPPPARPPARPPVSPARPAAPSPTAPAPPASPSLTLPASARAPAVAPPARAGRGRPADTLYLVGIGAHVPGADAPRAALRQVPAGAPRVVLMHNPASFPALPPGSAPLALAGHTHGGQIRLPFKPEWSGWTLIHHKARLTDGWLPGRGAAGNLLYVNRGIGFSHLPLRFACPPELTFLTLRAA